MADLRHGNMNGDQNNLIACRICDCIFSTRKDLFDHIELHFLIDESEAKRKLLLSHISSTSHPQVPTTQQQQDWLQQRLLLELSRTGRVPSTLPSGEVNRNPFSVGVNARTLDQQSAVRTLPVSSTGNNSNPTLPRQREVIANPFSFRTNSRTLDQRSSVRPLPVSFHLTGNNLNPTPSRPREINRNPFSSGTNARTLDQQSTVGSLSVSFQSMENNSNPTPPWLRGINRNSFSIGTTARTLDQQLTVGSGSLPVSFQSEGNNSNLTVPPRSRRINTNPFPIGANARNLDQQLTVASLPVSFQSTGNNLNPTPPRQREINTNSFSIGTNAHNLDQQLTVAPQPSCNSIPTQSTLVSVLPQIMTVQQSRVELFTRPFLHQLEARLLIEGMATIVDRQIDGNASGQEELDVTLKL